MDSKTTKAIALTQKGVTLANNGEIDKAIPLFKRSLELFPSAQIHYLLGLSYQNLKKEAVAEKHYLSAISLNPKFSMAYNNLGAIYLEQNEYDKALNYFSNAALIDPANSMAINNIGNVYKQLGDYRKAKEKYLLTLKINPQSLETYNNLGVMEYDQGNFKEAIKYFLKMVEINPKFPPGIFQLAVAYSKEKNFKKAIECLKKYSEIVPEDAKSYTLLADFYLSLKKYDLSLQAFNKSLEIEPGATHVTNDLGNLYKEMGDYVKAQECYEKVIRSDPSMAGTYNNLGVICLESNLQRSEEYLNKALSLEPSMASAHYHLGLIYERQHKLDMAEKNFRSALELKPNMDFVRSLLVYVLMQKCNYPALQKEAVLLEKQTQIELKNRKRVNETPFLNVIRKDDIKENYLIAQNHSQQIEENIADYPPLSYGLKKQKKQLKIGYLSCDYSDHATSHLILGLFKAHDRKKFKVYNYSYGADDGSIYRKRIAAESDIFRDIKSLSFREAANLINEDGIDILVDLKGHTKNTRLEIPAFRPAPVQVAYLGFPGTTGAKFFDYILTDRIVTPAHFGEFFSEKFAYLPDCYQINNNDREIANIKYSRKDFGLPPTGFVFSSFNHTYKIDSLTFSCWMRILKEVPESVLWLLKSNPFAEKYLKKEAQKQGVLPERIVFTEFLPNSRHLSRIRLSDLALDTFICNGHTTTSDALWAGVPVVTLQGKHFASRVASSILTAAGLPDLVTKTEKEYEQLAISLAKNPKKLEAIRESLNKNRNTCSLFDTKKFVSNLEISYSKMWTNYVKGNNPTTIEI